MEIWHYKLVGDREHDKSRSHAALAFRNKSHEFLQEFVSMTDIGTTFESVDDEIKSNLLPNSDHILNGIDIVAEYVGAVESKIRETDKVVATRIYNMYHTYRRRKKSITKSRKVIVCINTERICIESKEDHETLLVFPLTQVLNMTMCLNKPPYSKICVMVAREREEINYSMHVFYCEAVNDAIRFYMTTNLAFQMGFRLQNKIPCEIKGGTGDKLRRHCYHAGTLEGNNTKSESNVKRFWRSMPWRKYRGSSANTSVGIQKSTNEIESIIEMTGLIN